MNRDTKIPAFTLNELIVVMVITVVVIGLAYSILSLVQTHMKAIDHNLENATEVNLIEQALTLDFNTYNQMKITSPGHLSFKNELDSISYDFEENILIRETDTFAVKIGKTEFFLDNVAVISGKFDAVRVIVNPQGRERDIFIYRQNDAQTYMN